MGRRIKGATGGEGARKGARATAVVGRGSEDRSESTDLPPQVLVLATHKSLGLLIQCELNDRGMEAAACHSVRDAVELLSSGHVFVVIVDPREIDWREAEAQRLLGLCSGLPVVAFTSLPPPEVARMPLPFVAAVPKTSDLEPLIQEVLRHRGE